MTLTPHVPKQAKHTSHAQLELEALLRFFQKTGGAKGSWKRDAGWHALENAVEQTADVLLLRGPLAKQLPLHGVEWDRNHVVMIDLSANNLSGSLPKQLGHLRSLKQLQLRNNPLLKGPVPEKLYHMPRLQYCYVDGTRLENVLPHHEAHSFQITQLHSTGGIVRDTGDHAAATVAFTTGSRDVGLTRWVADMTEAELFMVHSTLQARHKPPESNRPETPQRTASNATGPERVEAAIKLQRIYRARMARTKFRQFLKSLFDKHVDSSTGFAYFVDSRTGESMWERPTYVGRTPRRDDGSDASSNQDLWQAFDDGNGNTYYWNRVTGESTWEPPAFLSRIYTELRARYTTATTDDERFDLFFRDIDKDSTGSIDRDEFALLCGELGMAMSPTQIEKVFDELDTSKDGELSREEITAWLTRNY